MGSFASIKAFFDSVLGLYQPMTVTIDGVETALSGLAGVDWPYIVRAVSVLLAFYCVARLLGGWLVK